MMVAALLLGGGIFATTSTGLGRAVDGSLDSRSEPAPGALEDDSPASDGSTSEPTSEIESSSVGTLDDGSTVAALQLNTVAESAGDDETDTTTGFDAPPLVDSDLSAEPDESSLSDTDAVATPTPTPEATASPAAIATATATPSPSPVPAAEMIETPTPTPTQQPTQTPVLLPTATATAAPTRRRPLPQPQRRLKSHRHHRHRRHRRHLRRPTRRRRRQLRRPFRRSRSFQSEVSRESLARPWGWRSL